MSRPTPAAAWVAEPSLAVEPRLAAVRILLGLAWVFLIALWPPQRWGWHAVSVGLLVALTLHLRVGFRALLRRWAVLWFLAALMSLGLWGQPGWGLRTANLFLKSSLCLWTVSLVVHSLGLQGLLAGLRHLRVPRLWTETLSFWGRYSGVLGEEWDRLQLARRARAIDDSRRQRFAVLTRLLGVLFIRAYERAEQVHHAMLARGYREGD